MASPRPTVLSGRLQIRTGLIKRFMLPRDTEETGSLGLYLITWEDDSDGLNLLGTLSSAFEALTTSVSQA